MSMDLLSKIKIIERKKIEDSRGWFLKVINGLEENLPGYTGEVYLTNATQGEAKGGHYHEKANEWFTLITGECELKMVDIITGEKQTLFLSSNVPKTIYVPCNIAHIFINPARVRAEQNPMDIITEGSDILIPVIKLEEFEEENLILLAYSDQLFVPEDTIMFSKF